MLSGALMLYSTRLLPLPVWMFVCEVATEFVLTTSIVVPSAPALAAPTNGSANQQTTLTLTWGISGGAATYSVEVSTDATFGSIAANQNGVAGTSAVFSGLANGMTYYWQANATNVGGTSAWSSVWSFSTAISAPNSTTQLLPVNGASGQPVTATLVWDNAAMAASYWMEIATDNAYTIASLVLSDSTITDTTTAVNGLSPIATYYWRVRAKNTSAWAPGPAAGVFRHQRFRL